MVLIPFKRIMGQSVRTVGNGKTERHLKCSEIIGSRILCSHKGWMLWKEEKC